MKPVYKSMEELLARFVKRDQLSTQEIENKLRQLDFTAVSEIDAVIALADLLLHEEIPDEGLFEFPPGTPFTDRMIRLKDRGSNGVRRLLCGWFYVATPSSLYPLFLYNVDYGASRTVLNLLLKSEKDTPPPYLFRVLQNILLAYFPRRQVAPLIADQRNIAVWAPALNEMFETERPISHWLKTKDNTLRFYGGQTNTILEFYDRNCNSAAGFDRINRYADLYCDLGGGFNTPEIVRLSDGLPFTSYDIISPMPTKNLMLTRRTFGSGELLLSKPERQDYLDKLKDIPYVNFDVFENHFPTDKNSYVIVSTGFLTSTVRANTKEKFGGNGFYATSLAGVKRIMELVRLGKDVDLFTVNRATSRMYSSKTVFASFRQGRLVDLVTTPDVLGLNRYTSERKEHNLSLIHPDSSQFASYLGAKEEQWAFFPPSQEKA